MQQPDEEASPPASPPPSQRRNIHTRRRRTDGEATDVASDSSAGEGDTQLNGTLTQDTGDGSTRSQMVKKMVRLALANEYARQPIRRADIGVKGQFRPASACFPWANVYRAFQC